MGARRVCQVLAVLSWLLSGILLFGLLPGAGPDPSAAPAAVFLLLHGGVVLIAGEFAALRQRVDRLEGQLQRERMAAPDHQFLPATDS